MSTKDQFLPASKRAQPTALPHEFSDEEMARDWTLSPDDKVEITKYRHSSRLVVAVQLCAVRLYGRFLTGLQDLSPRILNYLTSQLALPPILTIAEPEREATMLEHRHNILRYLGFQRFDDARQVQLQAWLEERATQGVLPEALFQQAEAYLLTRRTLLPGPSVLERLIIHVCSRVHAQLFAAIAHRLPPALQHTIEQLLTAPEGEQRSSFAQLKEYPPAATISSLQTYLRRYQTVVATGIEACEPYLTEPTFQDYLFRLTKKYNAKDLKRFTDQKRYTLMVCFLLETRKELLDYLARMHDQYVTELCRQAKNTYEKKHRELRKRQKRAVDTVLDTSPRLLDWPEETPLFKHDLWSHGTEKAFRAALGDLRAFQQLEERGYGDLLLARYPSLRKYFAEFLHLPFAAEHGSAPLLRAIDLVRQLDAGTLKQLPRDAPISFVPPELQRALKDRTGALNRNAWETGLALALKDALRSGDLYLPQSKHHVSFWDFMLSEPKWQTVKAASFVELQQPEAQHVRAHLTQQFHEAATAAHQQFALDTFAEIHHGHLKLKREDKAPVPDAVPRLQRVIDASLPPIRIEHLLMEVDHLTHFSRHFTPLQGSPARPQQFYKTLLATLISQATNLGVVAMSASVHDLPVDRLRHVLHFFIREDTLTAANAEIVNHHHQLPLSAVHGSGTLSSSDAQRFPIRASSLLAAYYPRYYGYYEKAIGIYTHVSDQYSVFSTKVISCSPREALYVLDGLLENNTTLRVQQHTTDTHGYTEIVFALCHLLGYDFMPRIRDLKDQQLYRIDRHFDYGIFTPLLIKTADLDLVEEQWEAMLRVALSLKQQTVPAHIVVQRLTTSFPSDRLSKAVTHLGRIIKTQYILRSLTEPELRRTVQRQLNKGEYRHKLPRRIFFADQGEFTTGDYEAIMNKASCLSLVSNAILYWNTLKIADIVDQLRQQGETVEEEMLAHISLLPFKHVLPNGTYFNEDYSRDFDQKASVLIPGLRLKP
jgi:TnpA family transposase